MRLRSIVRHRERRDGRASGLDHQRYPNYCFIRPALISLTGVSHSDPPVPPET